ncbi:MAG: hypothetical protein E6144_03780 [Finegoldia magna]|nr:hypothetical protein [Finegoldia magna]
MAIAFVSQKYSAARHLRFREKGEQEEQNIISSFLNGRGEGGLQLSLISDNITSEG